VPFAHRRPKAGISFWDKFKWILKRTIGWLIDKAKPVFNLDRKFDWLREKINKLLDASGINAVYSEVEGMLQRMLQPCYDGLAELSAPIGGRLGIEQAYQEVRRSSTENTLYKLLTAA
jgi:hypothetical protein